MDLLAWIKAFLSYGFLLGVDEPALPACLDAFRQKGITASVIGEILKDRRMILRFLGAEATLFDFTQESLTGGPA